MLKKITPALALLLLLTACGQTGKPAGSAGGSSTDAPARRFLSLGSAPAGGSFFVIGGALTEVASQFGPAGWQVTNEATKGSRENIRRLASGELDFALSNASITYFAVRGEAGWDQSYPMRSVMTLAPNVAFFITRADSPIRTIHDLAGKRVVIGPAGAGFEMFVTPIVEAHGVKWSDFTPLNATQGDAPDLLADGSADAIFIGGAVPTASITQAAASMDVFFIPFDEDARQKLAAGFPFFELFTVPAGTYRGQESDFLGLNVGSMHLITAAAQDETTVYQFVKTIYENREKVVERHAAGKAIQPAVVVRDVGTPFHPGAERYYREIGIWPETAHEP